MVRVVVVPEGRKEERASLSCGRRGWELAATLCLRGPWGVLEPGCRISGSDTGVSSGIRAVVANPAMGSAPTS